MTRTITSAEELEALPDGVFFRASGRYATIPGWQAKIPTTAANTGHFENCTVRTVPRNWVGGTRVFEVLMLGASRNNKGFEVTTAELMIFPVSVLWEEAA